MGRTDIANQTSCIREMHKNARRHTEKAKPYARKGAHGIRRNEKNQTQKENYKKRGAQVEKLRKVMGKHRQKLKSEGPRKE